MTGISKIPPIIIAMVVLSWFKNKSFTTKTHKFGTKKRKVNLCQFSRVALQTVSLYILTREMNIVE